MAGLFLLAVVTGVIESTRARLRLLRVPQLLVSAGFLSALALALVIWIWLKETDALLRGLGLAAMSPLRQYRHQQEWGPEGPSVDPRRADGGADPAPLVLRVSPQLLGVLGLAGAG